VTELGQMGRCGRKRKKERKAYRPGNLRAELEEEGEREREGEERVSFFFFLLNFFQIYFSNTQTPIKQNPCIRIMMHKHLLFLIYFNDI
jgi:hypothetical protein